MTCPQRARGRKITANSPGLPMHRPARAAPIALALTSLGHALLLLALLADRTPPHQDALLAGAGGSGYSDRAGQPVALEVVLLEPESPTPSTVTALTPDLQAFVVRAEETSAAVASLHDVWQA